MGVGTLDDIERVSEGRSQLLRFSTGAAEATVARIVGQLSTSAALFAHHPGPPGDVMLRPIPIAESLTFGSDLVSTQRYRGKTNERLTRAMLNIALAAAGIDPSQPSGTVLDPLCGRGTTLNWALAYGLDTTGVEADRSSLDHHASFLQTWAKRSRLPHKMQRFRRGNGEQRGFSFRVAPDRATFKNGGQQLETFAADAADTSLLIRKSAVDVVVTDLPYGIQHRDAAQQTGGRGLDPMELLERSLPTWRRWIRPAGAICLAWNTKRAGRREVSRILATAGFSPVTAPGGYSMRHVVDATIDRDVITAVRSG